MFCVGRLLASQLHRQIRPLCSAAGHAGQLPVFFLFSFFLLLFALGVGCLLFLLLLLLSLLVLPEEGKGSSWSRNATQLLHGLRAGRSCTPLAPETPLAHLCSLTTRRLFVLFGFILDSFE